MIIYRTLEFLDDYEKLQQKEKKQMDKALRFLVADIRHPSLRIKKTQGELIKGIRDLFEGRINRDYRFLFIIEDSAYVLLHCGKHDNIF